MEANELIKRINSIVDDAIKESSGMMERLATCYDRDDYAAFYKASGIHKIASEIKLLLIKEGGLL